MSYYIEEKDFIRINIWAGLERSKMSGFLFNYGFYLMNALLAIAAIIAKMPYGYFIFIGLLTMFPIIIRLSVIRRAKKNFSKNGVFKDHMITMTVDEEKICETFYTREYCNKWEEILMVSELKNMFVILVENIRVLYIPKSAIAGNDRATFRELVMNKLDKKRIRNLKH